MGIFTIVKASDKLGWGGSETGDIHLHSADSNIGKTRNISISPLTNVNINLPRDRQFTPTSHRAGSRPRAASLYLTDKHSRSTSPFLKSTQQLLDRQTGTL